MRLISKTLAKVICAGAKMFSMPMMTKSSSFSVKEKTNAQRLTNKAYERGTSKQNCGTLGPKDHQLKLISIRGDRNWKWTKANVGD